MEESVSCSFFQSRSKAIHGCIMEPEKRSSLLGIYCSVNRFPRLTGLKQQTFIISVSVGQEFGRVFGVFLAAGLS